MDGFQLSDEKKAPGIYVGDYTTQLNEEYNKPLQGSNNQYNGK